jgi:lipopolysaccharide transport system ATP-binding protein
MSETVIKVESLCKKYFLKHVRSREDGLRHIVQETVMLPWRKLRFRPSNTNLNVPEVDENSSEEFWALRDVSFEIKRGDVVGIIGRNGAGKSTLLKVLSRITEPTSGRIGIKGRVASLLEVGTGFHPELTGRENIYLNGAILGMTRAEVRCKFDEIVCFAEVEKFLDTPVKRYSSGMYVRLAFAVAAHLEPEILIVDEVLAVGDAEFQKKCLGKMKDVSSKGGRTVLLVSHNMAAIRRIANKAILLKGGLIDATGGVDSIANRYLSPDSSSGKFEHIRGKHLIVTDVYMANDNGDRAIEFGNDQSFNLIIAGITETSLKTANVTVYILAEDGSVVLHTISSLTWANNNSPLMSQGSWSVFCNIPSSLLNPGMYKVSLAIDIPHVELLVPITPVHEFRVRLTSPVMSRYPESSWSGYIGSTLPQWGIWDSNSTPKAGQTNY